MSTHVEVISTDLRRAKVKVSPGSYMVDVRDEACAKLNMSSDRYLLKYKQKVVDLTDPFRTAGLPPGAKLELVFKSNTTSVVTIRVDVQEANGPTVQRNLDKIPTSMTLWQVLRQAEETRQAEGTAGKKLIITSRATPRSGDRALAGFGSGQLYYEAPVVNIIGREYSSLADLQKTLSQCGIDSGTRRVLFRVSFRTSDKTMHEAMEEIQKFMKDVDEAKEDETPQPDPAQPLESRSGDSSATRKASEDVVMKEAEKVVLVGTQDASSKAGDETLVDPLPEHDSAQPVPSDPLQPTGIFAAPTSSTPAAALTTEPDSVFEPSIAHAQLRQKQLVQRSQNVRLKSDAELAADAAAQAEKLAQVKEVAIKVRFPDGMFAQWNVNRSHTGAFLYAAVRSVMRHPTESFRLVMPGGQTTVQESDIQTLIGGYKFRGNVLVNLLWDDKASDQARKDPFLKSSVASQARELVVPEVPKGEEEDAEETRLVRSAKSSQKQDVDGGGEGKKMPKWFKFGKK